MLIYTLLCREPNGGRILKVRDSETSEWREIARWNAKDVTGEDWNTPIYFSGDGRSIYMQDSRGSNTAQFVEIDIATGNKRILAQHENYDIGSLDSHVLRDPVSGRIQAVGYDGEQGRFQWIILDESIRKNFDQLRAVHPDRDFRIVSQSSDNNTWIVRFDSGNAPSSYYSYNRKTGQATLLRSDNPELAGQRLGTVHHIGFRSSDGFNNAPLKVYYLSAGSDYIEVASATNAAKLVLTEIGFFNVDDPLRLPGLAQPHHEDIAQTIKWIGGQILEREVNIQEPEYIPCEDNEIKSAVGKLIEAGILELKEGEVLTVELEINEGDKHEVSILRASNEVFLPSINMGFAYSIKELNSGEEKYKIGLLKFGTGKINLKCQVPIFTTHPSEKPQEITYHSGFDADASIPEELKQGYDVLWAKETYILKDTSIKQRLYELLRSGGKAIFTTCKSRTIEDLKTNFPMFDFSNSVTIPIPDSDFSYIIVEK